MRAEPCSRPAYGPGRFQFTVDGSARGFDEPPREFGNHHSPLFGTVARVDAHGRPRVVADLPAYEEAGNIDGGTENESNPYGILDASVGTIDRGTRL